MGPVTVELVRSFLGLPEPEGDSAALDLAVSAANAFVKRYKGDLKEWPPDYRLGAVMQAANLYRRRNTPGGVDTFGETGVYVRATDTEVERLLRIGRYSPPGVG